MSAPKVCHRVTFEVEDGCITVQKAECLSEHAAWCLVGCPDPTCDDWGHGDDGCHPGCNRVFDTVQGLSLHGRRAHGGAA